MAAEAKERGGVGDDVSSGGGMGCYAIRGAVNASRNGTDEILDATQTLLERMVAENGIGVETIASVIFSATADLDAVPPAQAARELGWLRTPLLCVQEMNVHGALALCIRVLMNVNGDRSPDDVRHVYLGAARLLRPDLTEKDAA